MKTQNAQIVSGLNLPIAAKPLGEQRKAVRRQELMVFLGNFGIMAAGIGLGLPTVTLQQLTDPTEAVHFNQSQASWYASLNTLSCPLGGLLSCCIMDRIGRKNSLLLMNLIAIAAWTLVGFANEDDTSVACLQLMASRFCIGIVAGLASAPAGVYSAEISLPKTRARLILGTSISIAAGITVIYFVGYLIRDDYRQIAKILLCYQICALLCVLPMPETPSWLMSKGKFDQAKRSLNYFRGIDKTDSRTYEEIEIEFTLLRKSIQQKNGETKPSLLSTVRQPEVYKPLSIMIGLFACQQFSGIFVIIVYAVQIATDAGVQIDPFMCAVMIGAARLVTTCPMGWILDKWGRRQAGIISASGMAICMWILAARPYIPTQDIPHLATITIVSFIVLSTLGLYTLPFFMISEVFPQKVRGPAAGITVACGLLISFITIKSYPTMKNAIGTENCFAVFGVNSFLSILYIYFFLPETKGRTLLEIENSFRSGATKKEQEILDSKVGSLKTPMLAANP